MILYFSGTGNSKMVAEQLAKVMKERLHSIEDGRLPRLKDSEDLLLVAPLYFWSLPSLVLSYLAQERASLPKDIQVVMTCGGNLGGGASLITAQLGRLGFDQVYVYGLVMTTNYIPFYKMEDPDKAGQAIQTALDQIPELVEAIRKKRSASYSSLMVLGRPLAQWLYGRARQTKHFWVNDKCTACGLCQKACPSQAIRLENKLPQWTKAQCSLCLRCLHRCPSSAIEYGKSTLGKARYHPKMPLDRHNEDRFSD